MLAKSARLNLKNDFKWVAQGKKLDSKYARIFIRIGDNPGPRIGIALTSKLFTKAIVRSRMKRIFFAIFASLYLSLPKGINILVLPKITVLGVKSGDLLLYMEEFLENEKIINKSN